MSATALSSAFLALLAALRTLPSALRAFLIALAATESSPSRTRCTSTSALRFRSFLNVDRRQNTLVYFFLPKKAKGKAYNDRDRGGSGFLLCRMNVSLSIMACQVSLNCSLLLHLSSASIPFSLGCSRFLSLRLCRCFACQVYGSGG